MLGENKKILIYLAANRIKCQAAAPDAGLPEEKKHYSTVY